MALTFESHILDTWNVDTIILTNIEFRWCIIFVVVKVIWNIIC